MTVGWIFEGDRDRFLAATDLPLPTPTPPPAYQCPFCKLRLTARRLLSSHLEKSHVVKRPFLTISGEEPGREDIIRDRSRLRSLEQFNSTALMVGIDGEEPRSMETDRLLEIFATLTRATVQIRLLNVGDNLTAPIFQDYNLKIIIPDSSELSEIDERFVRELGSERLNIEQVSGFYAATRSGASAEYAEALADYVRGVLIKDGDPNTGVSTRVHHTYDIFNRVLSTLVSFDRPLSKLICALVRFGLNDFSQWSDETGFEMLDHANNLLGPLAGVEEKPLKKLRPRTRSLNVPVFSCPIDLATDSVTRLAKQASQLSRWGTAAEQQFSTLAEQTKFHPLDQAKIRALWAHTALRLNASASAQKALGALDGDPAFGSWTSNRLAEAGL